MDRGGGMVDGGGEALGAETLGVAGGFGRRAESSGREPLIAHQPRNLSMKRHNKPIYV